MFALSSNPVGHQAVPAPAPVPHQPAPGASQQARDGFERRIDYLRISLTNRCNQRCLYCRPEGHREGTRDSDNLTAEEIIRVVCLAAELGFRKIRLTGGEPLFRPDLPQIVHRIARVPGVEAIGLSTNGSRLAPLAITLRQAGLRTLNISLDALTPKVYRQITGGDIQPVLEGIHAATRAGYECIKLNCVLMRGINLAELWPLVLFAADCGLPLRLIELMPVSRTDVLTQPHFVPEAEVMDLLSQHDELIPQPDRRLGHGPARYFLLKRTGALVGLIGSITTPHFCASCNRLRLTADGKLRPCLGRHGEIDLHHLLRAGAQEETIRELLCQALRQKPREHDFHKSYQPSRPMIAIGG